MAIQIIPNTYIDEEKLKTFLSKTFGRGNFRMQYKAGQWTIKAPRALTDPEIESVEQPGQY